MENITAPDSWRVSLPGADRPFFPVTLIYGTPALKRGRVKQPGRRARARISSVTHRAYLGRKVGPRFLMAASRLVYVSLGYRVASIPASARSVWTGSIGLISTSYLVPSNTRIRYRDDVTVHYTDRTM